MRLVESMSIARGQAEIIGGMIALAVLIVSVGVLYTALTQLSTTSTKGFSERAGFEAERNIEKLTVIYMNGRCLLVNQGPIPLTIIRIWVSGTPIDIDPLPLEPGSSRSTIAGGGQEYGIDNIDIAVTGRGNVIEVKRSCETLKRESGSSPPPSLFTSEQILNTFKISKGLSKGYLYVNIKTSDGRVNIDRAVIYFNGSKWLCSSKTNKATYTENTFNINRDMDANGVNEIITIDTENCPSDTRSITEYNYAKGFKGNINYTFKDLIYIPEGVDTITVHFKVVANIEGGGTSQDVSILPTITILYFENGNEVKISSPSTVSTASSGSGIAVVSGYAVLPIKAFNLNIIEDAVYSMRLNIEINAASSLDLGVVRLEYLAITGAYVANPWLE